MGIIPSREAAGYGKDSVSSVFGGTYTRIPFKDKAAEMLPAFKANAALFIAQNPDKIDLVAFTKPAQITPAGQAFVPHVNADEDDDLKGLMPTDEEAGMRKVA